MINVGVSQPILRFASLTLFAGMWACMETELPDKIVLLQFCVFACQWLSVEKGVCVLRFIIHWRRRHEWRNKKTLICVESYSRELEVISSDRLVNTENEKKSSLALCAPFFSRTWKWMFSDEHFDDLLISIGRLSFCL